MSDETGFVAIVATAIISLILGIALCVSIQRHYEYKNAFSLGYSEVQNVGTSGTHWEKIP
jgi:hypothetical protein